MADKKGSDVLKGTTLKVYHYIFKQGKPVGVHEVQRGLTLSSPSLALYHISKLLEAGLVREEGKGYIVDRVVFENMIRVRRTLIPFHTTYAIFFITTLLILLTYLRPSAITSTYVFSLIVNIAAILVSIYEAIKALKKI
ncbi:MAG: ArsR family transcriptional regulator [Nitrososphaeria archaeon]